MNVSRLVWSSGLVLLATPALAQISLPTQGLPSTGSMLEPLTERVFDEVDKLDRSVARNSSQLADLRRERLEQLVRRNRNVIELDSTGEPARRGTLLLLDPSADDLRVLGSVGLRASEEVRVDNLGLRVVRVTLPGGMSLKDGEQQVRSLLPSAVFAADHLHFASGRAGSSGRSRAAELPIPVRTPVGVIDGAPGPRLTTASLKGFAKGAPRPSAHGSAIVSLLQDRGVRTIHVADVYGSDKAGGNAMAIASAIGWLIEEGARVINISLVGPKNPVLERVVEKAQARGVVIVAAVGNDGPASPPSYPASYDGVVAVSAVDSRNRVLIEAGRARHLDYVAPGADLSGVDARGKRIKLRGTSFAAPLAAARIGSALDRGRTWRPTVDAEAEDLGRAGPDPLYGRGLVCGQCRPRK